MPDLIYLLMILVCPIAMGVMMVMMMRGGRGDQATAESNEVARLRAEVEHLKADRAAGEVDRSPRVATPPPPPGSLPE